MTTIDIPDVVAGSIAAYDSNHEQYAAWAAARPMSAQLDRFTADLNPGASVLDAGCGSGRDLLEFGARGFDVVGVDGSAQMAARSRRLTGRLVLTADLRDLNAFVDSSFDGIWSCASLVHMPAADAAIALSEFRRLLTAAGRLFVTVKAGNDTAAWVDTEHGRRWFRYWNAATFTDAVAAAGFTVNSCATTGSADRTWVEIFATAN